VRSATDALEDINVKIIAVEEHWNSVSIRDALDARGRHPRPAVTGIGAWWGLPRHVAGNSGGLCGSC
jgi:hypothetical protein